MLFEKPDSKKKKREQMLKILRDNLFNSTAQILLKIYESPIKLVKLICFIILIASTGFCSFEILNCVNAYLNYEVNTRTSRILEISESFPVISICNKNFFTSDFSFDFIKQVISQNSDYLEDVFNETLMQSKTFIEKEKIIYNIKYAASAMASNTLSDSMRQKLGASIENFITNCKFKGKNCDLKSKFIWKYDSNHGNCFQFNTGYDSSGNQTKIETIEKVGRSNGLILTLSLNHNISKEFSTINSNLGVTVKIDDDRSKKKTTDYGITYNDLGLIDLPADFETNIFLEKTKTTKLPKPYSKCEIEEGSTSLKSGLDFLENFVSLGFNYSQQVCADFCVQEVIANKCNCTDIEMISFTDNVEKCYNRTQIECLDEIFFDADNLEVRNCVEKCPLECSEQWYDSYFSFSKIVSKNQLEADATYHSQVKLNIYYESLSFTIITESPTYTLLILLSNIGGVMSLFLGLSLISFFEIILSLVEILNLIFQANKNKIINNVPNLKNDLPSLKKK